MKMLPLTDEVDPRKTDCIDADCVSGAPHVISRLFIRWPLPAATKSTSVPDGHTVLNWTLPARDPATGLTSVCAHTQPPSETRAATSRQTQKHTRLLPKAGIHSTV